MDTSTGRIYTPEEMDALRQATPRMEGFGPPDSSGQFPELRRVEPDELAEARLRALGLEEADLRALAEGRLVPVSEEVVQQVTVGQRELERRRRRRRKSAREARRKNR